MDSNIFSRQRFGGISRYVEELAKALRVHSDIDVNFANIFSIRNEPSFSPAVKIRRLARGTGILAEVDTWLSSHLLWRGSVIHLPYHSARYRKVEIPIVLTVHDLISERLGLPAKTAVDERRNFWIQRADFLICVSECTRRDLIEHHNVDESKTRVIYHGAEHLTSLRSSSESASVQEILYVGGRQTYKGFADLLFAFSKSRARRTHRLVLLGGGQLQPHEKSLMAELGIGADAITWIEGDDQRLAQKLQSVDALVLPSHWEGFNLPGVEAAHFGCPIVARDTEVHKEILGEAAMYFDSGDLGSLIASLDFVSSNSSFRLDSTSRLPRDYSWLEAAAQTAAVYREIGR